MNTQSKLWLAQSKLWLARSKFWLAQSKRWLVHTLAFCTLLLAQPLFPQPLFPQPTSGQSSRKTPVEPNRDLLESLKQATSNPVRFGFAELLKSTGILGPGSLAESISSRAGTRLRLSNAQDDHAQDDHADGRPDDPFQTAMLEIRRLSQKARISAEESGILWKSAQKLTSQGKSELANQIYRNMLTLNLPASERITVLRLVGQEEMFTKRNGGSCLKYFGRIFDIYDGLTEGQKQETAREVAVVGNLFAAQLEENGKPNLTVINKILNDRHLSKNLPDITHLQLLLRQGNALLKQKKFAESADTFESALRFLRGLKDPKRERAHRIEIEMKLAFSKHGLEKETDKELIGRLEAIRSRFEKTKGYAWYPRLLRELIGRYEKLKDHANYEKRLVELRNYSEKNMDMPNGNGFDEERWIESTILLGIHWAKTGKKDRAVNMFVETVKRTTDPYWLNRLPRDLRILVNDKMRSGRSRQDQ